MRAWAACEKAFSGACGGAERPDDGFGTSGGSSRAARVWCSAMNERRRVTYRGNVQGVGFRATARGLARGRAVTGWVRNEPDGTVMVEVQGDRAAVEELLAALRREMKSNIHGEEMARVGVVEGEVEFRIER